MKEMSNDDSLIDQELYKNKLCQICKKSLKDSVGAYFRYYHPNCIVKTRKKEKYIDYIVGSYNNNINDNDNQEYETDYE